MEIENKIKSSVVLLLLLLLLSPAVSATWLDGWNYRKNHTIIGSSAGAQTDYQMRFNISWGNGTDTGEFVYLNESAQHDFDDIRFTSSDGTTLLNYWLEDIYPGNSTIAYVKIDTIPAYPSNGSVYIYYGNSTIGNSSDGNLTFMDYLYPTNWETFLGDREDDGVVTVVDSPNRRASSKAAKLRQTGVAGNNHGTFRNVLRANRTGTFIMEMDVMINQTNFRQYLTVSNDSRIYEHDDFSAYGHFSTIAEFEYYSIDGYHFLMDYTNNTWYKIGYHINHTNRTFHTYVNDTLIGSDLGFFMIASPGGRYPPETNQINIGGYKDQFGAMFIQDVRTRKWVEPEPAHGIWTSEENVSEDTNPPTWDQAPTDQTVAYGESLSYDINASDPSGIDTYFLNDTTYFQINSATGLITNKTGFTNGTYYYLTISVNDTLGYIQNATFWVYMAQEAIPTEEPSFVLWVFADTQPTSATDWLLVNSSVDDINTSVQINMTLMLGDIVNDGQTSADFDYYIDSLGRSQMPISTFHHLAGNHDFEDDHSLTNYNTKIASLDSYNVDRWNYSFSVGNILFIMVSAANETGLMTDAQFTFLNNTVVQNQDKIVIVSTHFPIYNTTYYSRYKTSSQNWFIINITNNPHPGIEWLLENYNIDVWMHGHNHIPSAETENITVKRWGTTIINVAAIVDHATPSGYSDPTSRILEFNESSDILVLKFRNHTTLNFVQFRNTTNGLVNEVYITLNRTVTFAVETDPPELTPTPSDQTAYNGTAFNYTLEATDVTGVDTISLNDTSNFTVTVSGSLGDTTRTATITNTTYLAIGTYQLEIFVNDTLGNSQTFQIEITVTEYVAPEPTTMRMEILLIHLLLFAILLLPSVAKGSRFFGIFAGLYLILLGVTLIGIVILVKTGEVLATGAYTFTNVDLGFFPIFIILIGMYLLARNAYSLLTNPNQLAFYR